MNDRVRKAVEHLNQKFKEGGGTAFGAASLTAARICQKTLEDTTSIDGDPAAQEGSAQAAAIDIQSLIDATKAAIEQGNADMAARMAWSAAAKFAMAEYEFQWKTDADRGRKVAGGFENSAHETNKLHAPLREQRFEIMREFVPKIGVDNAASEAEAQGLGKAQNIKRQWNRWKNRDT